MKSECVKVFTRESESGRNKNRKNSPNFSPSTSQVIYVCVYVCWGIKWPVNFICFNQLKDLPGIANLE